MSQAPDGPWKGGWERLIRDAEQSGYRKIVISNELLAPATVDDIRQVMERLSGADVHVIYTVRDLPGLVSSVWQQQAQSVRLAPWEQWLQRVADGKVPVMRNAHDVGAILNRWRRGGVHNIHVITRPGPGSAPNELWRRFQSVIGWRVPTDVDLPPANQSLGYSHAELLRRVHVQIGNRVPDHRRAALTKDLIASRVFEAAPPADTILIPNRLRPWFDAEAERRREQITDPRNHLVGDIGDLAADESKFCDMAPLPDETIMLDGAVAAIAALTENLAKQRERFQVRYEQRTGDRNGSSSDAVPSEDTDER